MLRNLHVKNLALIDEAEVDFEKGLNILTGETGAGKSIIIVSANRKMRNHFNSYFCSLFVSPLKLPFL